MRVPKQLGTIAIAAAVAGVVSFGAGAVVVASATGSSVTYQACVSKTGAMSKVGTVTPTCPSTSHVISWNSQGPAGAPGTNGAPGISLPAGDSFVNGYFIGPNANLTNANLSGANLSGVDWYYTTCPDGTNSNAYSPPTCIGHGI